MRCTGDKALRQSQFVCVERATVKAEMAQSSISSYYRTTRKRAAEGEAVAAKRRKAVSQEQNPLSSFIQPAEVSFPCSSSWARWVIWAVTSLTISSLPNSPLSLRQKRAAPPAQAVPRRNRRQPLLADAPKGRRHGNKAPLYNRSSPLCKKKQMY